MLWYIIGFTLIAINMVVYYLTRKTGSENRLDNVPSELLEKYECRWCSKVVVYDTRPVYTWAQGMSKMVKTAAFDVTLCCECSSLLKKRNSDVSSYVEHSKSLHQLHEIVALRIVYNGEHPSKALKKAREKIDQYSDAVVEVALQLYTENWEGSLDDLFRAAKSLTRKT